MSLPANDSLISGTTEALTTYSSNWSVNDISPQVGPSGCFTSSGNQAAFWNADSFPNDQYSSVVITSTGANGGNKSGPSVRCSQAGGKNRYFFLVGVTDGNYYVGKYVLDSFSVIINQANNTFNNGDVLKITAVGSLITVYQNGVFLNSVVDTSLTSGSAGMFCAGASNQFLTNWQGGVSPYAPIAWVV